MRLYLSDKAARALKNLTLHPPLPSHQLLEQAVIKALHNSLLFKGVSEGAKERIVAQGMSNIFQQDEPIFPTE